MAVAVDVARLATLVQQFQREVRRTFRDPQRPSHREQFALWDRDGCVAFAKKSDAIMRRRQDKALLAVIDQAFAVVRSGTVAPPPPDSDDSDANDGIDNDVSTHVPLTEYVSPNALNRSLHQLYGKSVKPTPTTPDDKDGSLPNGIVIDTDGDPKVHVSQTEASENVAPVEDENGDVNSVDQAPRKRRKDSIGNRPRKQGRTQRGVGSQATASPGNTTSGGAETPTVRLKDMGGMEQCLSDILHLVGMPLKHPEVYLHLGVPPPRGILLHGPPGCGKTMLANAIAGECGVPFLNISAPSIVSGMSGESEKKLREIFEEARTLAPCILFIDEIDAITPKRETAQREMERRIVAQLLTCLDSVSMDKTDNKAVVVIGATNRPDSLDPALRRAGRFDREIAIGVPDEKSRLRILQKLCEGMKLRGSLDFAALARLTPGFVGADLVALTAEAGMSAIKRIMELLQSRAVEEVIEKGLPLEPSLDSAITADVVDKVNSLSNPDSAIDSSVTTQMDIDTNEPTLRTEQDTIKHVDVQQHSYMVDRTTIDKYVKAMAFMQSRHTVPLTEEELNELAVNEDDFMTALKHVQPSAKREGFATVPDVTWNDIGALQTVQEELRMAIVEPVKHPEYFLQIGITSAMGVLLYGPPGCGKTLLAKAVASESMCNFISVKGPELLNKYVGESERAIRQVFSRAAASSPCVIFFDELDAICPARSNDGDSHSSSRLVNTLLTEMDGMQGRRQVYVMAATNRPDMIDPAMLRPGRLDKTLYVDLPSAEERFDILKTVVRRTPLGKSVDLRKLAFDPRCDGYSGADLAAFVREASMLALRERILNSEGGGIDGIIEKVSVQVEQTHFDHAFRKVNPSVTKRDRRKYELLRVKFGSAAEGNEKLDDKSVLEDGDNIHNNTVNPSTDIANDKS